MTTTKAIRKFDPDESWSDFFLVIFLGMLGGIGIPYLIHFLRYGFGG